MQLDPANTSLKAKLHGDAQSWPLMLLLLLLTTGTKRVVTDTVFLNANI